ncbi:hypothetical protein AB0F81_20745 [Actinoplanes sp. NPDC024001]|uniref:hypothetical protein n=1 Tax=Actinoplanes sp. NPDC024001 TaxID=3154598 RepID=UPI0033E9D29F
MLRLFVLVAAMVLAAPVAAHAEPYPVEPPDSGVSDGTVQPGGTVTFSGEGFLPFERISIEVGYDGSDNNAAFFGERERRSDGLVLAAAALPQRVTITTTADENGRFSVEVPLTEVGNATLVATGLTSGVTVTTVVEVVGDGDSGDGDDGGSGGGDSGDSDDSEDGDSDEALPTTGPSGTSLLLVVSSGVGAVLVGTAMLWLVRSRRRTDV